MELLQLQHTMGDLSARLGLAAEEETAAAVRALNRTITTGRKYAIDALRKLYPSLKASQLRSRIKLTRATRKELVATLTFSGKRFSLYGQFGMREIKAKGNNFGVRFARLPWRLETISGEAVTAEMLARAFRNRGRGGRPTVMSRHTRIRASNEVLVAPAIAAALVQQHIAAALLQALRLRFGLVFAQEARFILTKR